MKITKKTKRPTKKVPAEKAKRKPSKQAALFKKIEAALAGVVLRYGGDGDADVAARLKGAGLPPQLDGNLGQLCHGLFDSAFVCPDADEKDPYFRLGRKIKQAAEKRG